MSSFSRNDVHRHVQLHARAPALGIAALALGSAISPAQPAPATAAARIHARLEQLTRARRATPPSDGEVVAALWRDVARVGTPIVERLPGDSSRVRATFFYRDTTGARNVLLVGGIAGHTEALAQLERLGRSNVWFKTIDVRSDARIGYQFRLNDNLIPMFADPARDARAARGFRDPLNSRVLDEDSRRSLFEGPNAPAQPWIVDNQRVPRGTVQAAVVQSEVLGEARAIRVYTPPQFASNRDSLSLLVVFDGDEYTDRAGIPTPTILDNLVAANRVEPLIAVFVSNPAATRGVELMANERFAEFVARELVPWTAGRWRISRNPARHTIAGSSLGGLMASYVALRSPEVFGNVISQSGSYWWSPPSDVEAEWLTRRVVRQARANVRFFVEVGVFEIDRSRGGGPGQVVPNRHFRDVLQAKGYDVVYREFAGGHEAVSWRGTFSDAIEHFFHQ